MTDRHRQFEALLQERRCIVFKVASVYARGRENRADLAQEIAVQLWRSFGSYDPAPAGAPARVAGTFEAPVFAVLGAVIWVPMTLMLIQAGFDAGGGDYWDRAPWLAAHLLLSGLASIALVLLAYVLVRRAGHLRWLENNLAGGAVRKAEAVLQEIARFERDE